ncbi:GSCOCG00011761001-RA-CDS, partial [Cotesia congregata]
QNVADFLEKDENSRMCPGKKDFIRSKGTVKQKRLLGDTIKNLHKKFLATVEYKMSLATFCRFRPFWVTWANIKDRNTCQCMIHANMQLMIMKLHENKALPNCNLTKFLSTITCDVSSTKCLTRACEKCQHKMIEYNLPQPNRIVTFHQWIYETTSYEKDEKMKTVRKPGKKEIKIPIRELIQKLEETLPSFLQHVATIAHQYQTISELKKNLTENEVLIHIDFSENYCSKYNEEIQSVHFGGARKQITLHTGVLYLRENDTVMPHTFCSLSENNRHDSNAVWAHLTPIFEWIKGQYSNIDRIHILSDGPVNQYKNKFIFHIVSHHMNDLFSGITFFSWNYSEPGHGKGAPDGVGGTLKRTA